MRHVVVMIILLLSTVYLRVVLYTDNEAVEHLVAYTIIDLRNKNDMIYETNSVFFLLETGNPFT